MTTVLSPYGKPVDEELRALYGVESVEHLLATLLPRIEADYGVRVEAVHAVHVAYGLAVALSVGGRQFYYKLTSSGLHAALPAMFPWAAALKANGVQVPGIWRTVDGRWFNTPLQKSAFDVGYLMERMPGAPATSWSPARADACAKTLAAAHTLGRDHQPRVNGTPATFAAEWPAVAETGEALLAHPAVPRGPVEKALALIERTEVPPLVQTHIHGDARLCHVFFEGDAVSGFIDIDQGTWGDRLFDIVHTATSHPDPANVAWLNAAGVHDLLQRYDAAATLTNEERNFLPAALTFACLDQLAEVVTFLDTGRTNITEADVRRAVTLLDQLSDG